jgi:hypothetical protein
MYLNWDILIGGFLISFGIYFWARSYFRPEAFPPRLTPRLRTLFSVVMIGGGCWSSLLIGCSESERHIQ